MIRVVCAQLYGDIKPYFFWLLKNDEQLARCIVYIDLNMLLAGLVSHPVEYRLSGYNEIQNSRKKKGIIDFDRQMDLLGFENYDDLKDAHYKWVDSAMQTDNSDKEDKWT
jgi:putative transposase